MHYSQVALELYTVRDETKRDFAGTLRRVAQMGYAGVEFVGYGNLSAQSMNSVLAETGLKVPGTHVGLESLTAEQLDASIRYCRAINCPLMVLPSLPQASRTLEGIRALAPQLNSIGQRCRDAGLDFGYHNHDFEFASIEGHTLLEHLLEMTNPDLVKIELDVYWAAYAGHDPLALLNRLGQRGETDLGWNSAAYAARARAFGWHAVELNGHDLGAIDKAYGEALSQKERPTCLVARTEKGHGVSSVANKDGWHGKALPPDMEKAALQELGGVRHLTVSAPKPEEKQPAALPKPQALKLPTYEVGKKEATRKAYGDALVALGAARGDVVALDGEVSNSTHADEFKKAYPDRFFEMFIAEQQMVAAAVGLQVRHWKPFASTFAAFLSRAYDFIRMAAISQVPARLCSSPPNPRLNSVMPAHL